VTGSTVDCTSFKAAIQSICVEVLQQKFAISHITDILTLRDAFILMLYLTRSSLFCLNLKTVALTLSGSPSLLPYWYQGFFCPGVK